MTDNIALIDLDGTIADYDGAMKPAMQRLRAPEEPEYTSKHLHEDEPPYMEARRKLIQRQPGFWRNLEPLALGFDVVNELRRVAFDLHVLSKGPRGNGGAWGEKLEWAERFLPDAGVHVTSDKSLTYGRILVDDFPPYFTKWLQFRPRGIVVCVAQDWNAKYAQGYPNILRYDGSNKDELRKIIERAKNRKSGEHG